jgi:Cytochrome c
VADLSSCRFAVLLGILALSCLQGAEHAEKMPAERGKEAILTHVMNPPLWSLKAYDQVWKKWGLSEKPADYARAIRERYGLLAVEHDPNGLPLGLMRSHGLLGKGLVNNCMLCHAGRIAGQTYIGLGNASLDLQSLFEEMEEADGSKFDLPFQFSYVRGTIDAISPAILLLQLRDPDLKLQKPIDLDLARDVCSRPPSWWLLKRKKTRDWSGIVSARSDRVDLINLLHPFNGPEHIKAHEPTFQDILAFILAVEAPRYPFPIDHKLASRGRELFNDTCSRCHGTYGSDARYPNRIVKIDELGTDRILLDSTTQKNADYLNRTWLAQQIGPDGQPIRFHVHQGYQAPPLDGVWATAPYFHNGSIPTIYHVLNSKARPIRYSRSYRTEKEDYDPVRLGWKITVLAAPPSAGMSAFERRKIYDTTLRGQSNSGHTFGDKLSEDERMAVIEYLKML